MGTANAAGRKEIILDCDMKGYSLDAAASRSFGEFTVCGVRDSGTYRYGQDYAVRFTERDITELLVKKENVRLFSAYFE